MLQDKRIKKMKKRRKIKNFVVIAEYLEQKADCIRYKINYQIKKKSFADKSLVFTFPHQRNGSHKTELSIVKVLKKYNFKNYFHFFSLKKCR